MLLRSIFRLETTVLTVIRCLDKCEECRVIGIQEEFIFADVHKVINEDREQKRAHSRMDPCGTEALMDVMSDAWPDRTTLMDLLDR